MNNRFKYVDVPDVDLNELTLMNSGMFIEIDNPTKYLDIIKGDVKETDYASFEPLMYDTYFPKTLYDGEKFGAITNFLSTESGEKPSGRSDVWFKIQFQSPVDLIGVSVGFIREMEEISIQYTFDSNRTETLIFYPKEKYEFFPMKGNGVIEIKITLLKTKEPYRFMGIYRVDLGRSATFDKTNLVSARVTENFSIDGSTIEYDKVELEVFSEDELDFVLTKTHPLIYLDENENPINVFYVEDSQYDEESHITTIEGYDSISKLEDDFLGGVYGFNGSEPYDYNTLISDILDGTGVKYETYNTDGITVTGYIPICSRRKALVMLCKGTNTRCYKSGGVLIFKPLYEGDEVEYTESEIVVGATVKKDQTIGKMEVVKHNYQKTKEEIELYSWYIQQGENTQQRIVFSEPVWKVRAFEILGTDPETGEDIVDTNISPNVKYNVTPGRTPTVCHYIELGEVKTANKVKFIGLTISDNTEEIVVSKSELEPNAEYKTVRVEDVTVSSGVETVARNLFAIESTKAKQTFEVVDVDRPETGNVAGTVFIDAQKSVSIKDETANLDFNMVRKSQIVSVTDDMTDVYKVVVE